MQNWLAGGGNGQGPPDDEDISKPKPTYKNRDSNINKVIASGVAATATLVGDDVTGVGIGDDILIPFVWAGVSTTVAYYYMTADADDVGDQTDDFVFADVGTREKKNETITIYKAPQRGKGEILLLEGLQPKDFLLNLPYEDGRAYFAGPKDKGISGRIFQGIRRRNLRNYV